MRLEIDLSPESETVSIIVDNGICLKATKYSNDSIKYKNFEQIDDEEIYNALKDIADTLIALIKE